MHILFYRRDQQMDTLECPKPSTMLLFFAAIPGDRTPAGHFLARPGRTSSSALAVFGVFRMGGGLRV
jgi:hypothetical protein